MVEDPGTCWPFERTKEYNGVYHVKTPGLISPMTAVGPEQINVNGLLERVNKTLRRRSFKPPTPPGGGGTAMYIARLLKPLGVR